MAISMYNASVPQFKKMLGNLATILKKAEEHGTAKKIDGKVFLDARLFPNMFALTKQVQIACDQVKNGLTRLAGMEPLSSMTTRALSRYCFKNLIGNLRVFG